MPAAANTVKNLKFCPTICWAAEGELVDENHRGDRGALEHGNHVVGEPRQDRAHRLRQDDAPQGQERPHAERGRGDALVAVHRQDAAADDLGAERGFVEREADHRRREAVELDADRRQGVVEKDELQAAAACHARTRCRTTPPN